MRGRLLAVCLLFAALLPAQQVIRPGSTMHGAIVASKDGLVLPAGEFTVGELIDSVAAYLCRNYVYDHDAIARAGSFTLQRSLALDALGSEEVLFALVASRGFAVFPVDELRGVWQIVPLGDGPQANLHFAATPWRSAEEILSRPRLRELVLTAIELKHAEAEPLAAAVRGYFAGPGPWRPGLLTAYASRPKTLFVHGYREQVAQVLLLARQVDRATEPASASTDQLQRRIEALEQQVAELTRARADEAAATTAKPQAR